MKGGGNVPSSEAAVLQLITSKTNIRVPRVHRAWQVEDDTKYFGTMGYLIMDYIDGRPLDSCWDELSTDQKLDIANQTAQMVVKMQAIELSVPKAGPIGDWADAGAYPRVFESASLSSQSSFPDFNDMVLSRLPRYPQEEEQLKSIGYALSVCPLA
ncbi:hypothetical protein AnigIFM62618_010387 [Aspergillus niger]|nr:hypothetical protein AnigIFM62618_010387 [Aspergillus niger]